MALYFDRDSNQTYQTALPPGGNFGAMTFGRLCLLLETAGEVKSYEKVTGLLIEGDLISFKTEPRAGK